MSNKYNMYDFGKMTSALFRRPAHTLGGSLDVYLQIRKCKKPLKKAEKLLKKYKDGVQRERRVAPEVEHGYEGNTAHVERGA